MPKKIVAALLIALSSLAAGIVSFFATSKVALGADLPMPRAWGPLLGFVLIFGLVRASLALATSSATDRGTSRRVIAAAGVGLAIVLVINSIKGTNHLHIKMLPLYASWLLAVAAAGRHHARGGWLAATSMAVLPALLAFGAFEPWAHRIDYGAWTGERDAVAVPDFAFETLDGRTIDPERVHGKVVVFDFWFASCPACWKNFPKLQRLHESLRDDPRVELYAVNRFDDPSEFSARLADAGYDFPVLLASEEKLDALGVLSYPTLMVVNPRGELIFQGDIEDARAPLERLLDGSW